MTSREDKQGEALATLQAAINMTDGHVQEMLIRAYDGLSTTGLPSSHYDACPVCNTPTRSEKETRWQHIADQRAIEVADLRLALKWCVDHPGECLGDHPKQLARASEILQGDPKSTNAKGSERNRHDKP